MKKERTQKVLIGGGLIACHTSLGWLLSCLDSHFDDYKEILETGGLASNMVANKSNVLSGPFSTLKQLRYQTEAALRLALQLEPWLAEEFAFINDLFPFHQPKQRPVQTVYSFSHLPFFLYKNNEYLYKKQLWHIQIKDYSDFETFFPSSKQAYKCYMGICKDLETQRGFSSRYQAAHWLCQYVRTVGII